MIPIYLFSTKFVEISDSVSLFVREFLNFLTIQVVISRLLRNLTDPYFNHECYRSVLYFRHCVAGDYGWL